VIVAARTAL